jgi:predicted nucleic acid-binding protein
VPKSKQLVPVPLIYVDACVYLDIVTRNEEIDPTTGEARWRSARSVFDAAGSGQVRLAASPLLEAEVLCNGNSLKDSDRVRRLLRGWFTAESTAWTEIDRFLAREAVQIMRKFGHLRFNGAKKLGSADALHLAAAVRLNCDYFFTQDSGYPLNHRVEEVKVLSPQVVWQPSLFDRSA